MNRIKIRMYPFNRLLLALMCFGLAACGSAAPDGPLPTPTIDPLYLIKDFETAYNAHDFEAIKPLLTENIIFLETNWGINDANLEETLKRLAFYFGMNTRINLINCTSSTEAVSCKQEYSDDCFQAAGVSPYHEAATFLLDENKIKKITWDNDQQEDRQSYLSFQDKLTPWMQSNYYDIYNQLMNNEISLEMGKILSEKCKEFVSSP